MINLDPGQIIKKSYPDVLQSGAKTVGTDAVQLIATSTELAVGVWIKAHPSNSDNVYVGNSSGVTSSNGYILDAGEEVFVSINNLSEIYLIAGAADQNVRYIGS